MSKRVGANVARAGDNLDGSSYHPPSMQPPTGTVTLVFTDIQGSTKLWEELGERFGVALKTHNEIMRAQIAAHNGYEVKTEGDAFMVAFARSIDAVNFCLSGQEALARNVWDSDVGSVLVRMGVHSGEPQCEPDTATGRMDYFGSMVNRAARIGSAGHGGQILLSNATFEEVVQSLPEKTAITELGQHRLKGLERPERLWQVLPPSLSDRTFEPLKTLSAIQTNLPKRVNEFFGREEELKELTLRFIEQQHTVVSLIGPGGTGKTRLSQRWAAEQLSNFPAGVWFADLTEARTSDDICVELAKALEVPLKDEDLNEQIARVLRGRTEVASGPILLILDNLEQCIEAAASCIGGWCAISKDIRVLATSRIPLGLEQESQYPVEPLKLPPRKATENVGTSDGRHTAKLEAYSSIKLFVSRAKSADPAFKATDDNIEAIAQICVRLDGIPLAIELAAARSKIIKPTQLLKKLKDRFTVLKSSRRDLHARQMTLRGAIDWSWDLLSEAEQLALAQLSVCRGGFFLETAESVVDLSGINDAPPVMDIVQSLKEKSLLKSQDVESLGDQMRFGMYESIREYAAEKLVTLGCAQEASGRWTRWLLDYARLWWERRRGRYSVESVHRLGLEVDSLIGIAQSPESIPSDAGWAAVFVTPTLLSQGPAGVAKPMILKCLERLGVSIKLYNDDVALRATDDVSVDVVELRNWLYVALGSTLAKNAPTVAKRVCNDVLDSSQASCECRMLLGELLVSVGEQINLASYVDDALAHLSRNNSPDQTLLIGYFRQYLAYFYWFRGEYEKSNKVYREIHALAQKEKDKRLEFEALSRIAVNLDMKGQFHEAIEVYHECLALAKNVGIKASIAKMNKNLAGILMSVQLTETYENILSRMQEACQVFRELGDEIEAASTLSDIGIAYKKSGNTASAMAAYKQALSMYERVKEFNQQARVHTLIGNLLKVMNEYDQALAHYDRSQALAIKVSSGTHEGLALGNKGFLYHKMERYELAIECIERSMPLMRDRQDYLAIAHAELGTIYLKQCAPWISSTKYNGGDLLPVRAFLTQAVDHLRIYYENNRSLNLPFETSDYINVALAECLAGNVEKAKSIREEIEQARAKEKSQAALESEVETRLAHLDRLLAQN